MKNILTPFVLTLFAILTSCVNGDDYGTPDLTGECSDLNANISVSTISASASSSIQQYNIVGNDIIEAYVTSSDEGGNFYKSISLVSVDGSKGFSIPIDAYNLYRKYEPAFMLAYIHKKVMLRSLGTTADVP